MHFKNISLKHKRVAFFFHYVFFNKGFYYLNTDKGSYLYYIRNFRRH